MLSLFHVVQTCHYRSPKFHISSGRVGIGAVVSHFFYSWKLSPHLGVHSNFSPFLVNLVKRGCNLREIFQKYNILLNQKNLFDSAEVLGLSPFDTVSIFTGSTNISFLEAICPNTALTLSKFTFWKFFHITFLSSKFSKLF